MKNIIVPVDFSEESLKGLKIALMFSRKASVNIQMIHVVQKLASPRSSSADTEQGYAEKQLDDIKATYGNELGKDSKLQYLIREGRIFQEVAKEAKSLPDAVIAASTHGASGFQEFFIGSNAYRIICATDRPVITIRGGQCPENFSKIVLPVDTTIDSRQKVPFTIDLAQLFGSEIHVLGIQSSKSEREVKRIRTYTGQVAGFIQGRTRVVTNEVWGDNVADMVVNYARSVKADLISITTERDAGINLIIGNTAHQVLNRADIPVLSQSPKRMKISGGFSSSGG
ncbi:MAG: universal stress protein [Bacteroidales bacterium]|nr:universal stress protein [Bacteroidales bacterium]